MKILMLGGDGYLGWVLAAAFAARGDDVSIMDSLVKRKWEMECGAVPLFEVLPIHRRVSALKERTGHEVRYFIGDVTNVGAIYHVLDVVAPDVVINAAGQASAPFSMRNRASALVTQENGYLSALNVLFAVQRAQRPIHLISLGSLGVYGFPAMDVPEGYITIEAGGRTNRMPLPVQPRSFQQLAAASTSTALAFGCENWGLTITDVRLGIVYGFWTPETAGAAALRTSFYYDAVFGTVANRFGVQAAVGYPLTIHGDGEQTRPFLSLADMVRGLALVVDGGRPAPGRLRVVHHFGEVLTIRALADRVLACARSIGLVSSVKHVPNPRVEPSDASYRPLDGTLRERGLRCAALEETLNEDYFQAILREKDRIDLEVMEKDVLWRRH